MIIVPSPALAAPLNGPMGAISSSPRIITRAAVGSASSGSIRTGEAEGSVAGEEGAAGLEGTAHEGAGAVDELSQGLTLSHAPSYE